MKILVVCQHYWPEPYPLQDICEELVVRGHEVHVVTGVPNYPMGIIYPEYAKGKNRCQVHNGVSIKRTFTIGRRKNVLFRILNYCSYAISSCVHISRMKEEYDVVFACQTSPVIMSAAALKYAGKHGKKSVLYCMDLWPASLTVGGIREDGLIYRILGWASKQIYTRADRILITSEMFREYMNREFGIVNEKIDYLPQHADSVFQYEPMAEEKDTVDLMFAGNVGKAQSIDTILRAAKLLEQHRELRWHIVGDGSELESCRKLAQRLQLENVLFHGRRPQEEMPDCYALADAMLITLTGDPYISHTLPRKVQTYMAAGKPIVGAANGEIPKTIAKCGCGYCGPAEDPQGLADAVLEFLNCEDKARLGRNARRYYEENFTRSEFMDRIEKELLEAAGCAASRSVQHA
ncbi:MAG: glycosyltransferase family 4 protein [Oscillospiraceae bacterium]|nr:glycosyltransferase family 4 protein [Oscillospiraceae bacterium]